MADALQATSATGKPGLFALVDLARAPHLVTLIDYLARDGTASCLFEGRLDERVRRVSPFIVDLWRAPALLHHWHAQGIGQSWGVILETPLAMHLARRHVRRFLQVRLPDGSGPVLMRFWDPRVLGPLLNHVDAEQRAALFRDVVCYWLEYPDGRRVFADGRCVPTPLPTPAMMGQAA